MLPALEGAGMEHVEVAGLRIAYRRTGSGPALVLLHGGVCDGRVWRVELESFADAFTVVAWDAPGCGGSSDAPDDFTMSDYAECLLSLLETLDLAPAHLLGHSWGATVALQACRLRPSAVRSLVLVGGYAGWAGSLPPAEVSRRLEAAQRAADPGSGVTPTAVPGLFSDAMPADRADELAGIMADARTAATRTMARALAVDLRDALDAIDVPTLLVHGGDDARSPVPVGEALHRSIRHSELVVLPGLGHECYLESPDRFEAAVRPFLLAQENPVAARRG